jgi:hypothetical protein
VARSKTSHWHDLKSRRTTADLLGVAVGLRRATKRLLPGWPSLDERLDDVAVHQRVAEVLRAVVGRPR